MITDHTSPFYTRPNGPGKYNGAYYYSCEIVKNIIPQIRTDRDWLTINAEGAPIRAGTIVFIHNNLYPKMYNWLQGIPDLILVCGIPETTEKVRHLGTPIYLPLSVDVEEVRQYRTEKKTRGTCYAGRSGKKKNIPNGTELLQALPRPEFLRRLAEYENAYAVGRVAIEAKILKCNILPYDDRFPDPSRWEVIDNSEAAQMLQIELDRIDR